MLSVTVIAREDGLGLVVGSQKPPERTSAERLRNMLHEGKARRRLTIATLAAKSLLARTTVSEALAYSDKLPPR
jgi:hypothetical protein